MIHHCVFLNFREDCDRFRRDEILSAFVPLVGKVSGMLSYDFGPNADFEAKSAGYSDGFVAVFADLKSMTAYEASTRHLELGQMIVENCVGGHEGIVVFDIVSE